MRRIFLALLLTTSSLATAEPLAPFAAEFRIYVNKLPTPVKADLVLEPAEGKDYYRMLLKAKSFLLTNTEESYFHWRDCQPRTTQYVHEFKGFGQHRYHHMDFQWNPPMVHNESEDDQESLEIPENTLDELTILLRGRCVFATGDKSYSVVEKKREGDSKEKRRTLFWVAPSLDYMVVKARHIESTLLKAELIMIDYDGPDVPPLS